MKEEGSTPNPLGMCEKVFNALKINPTFRPLRRISYRPEPVANGPHTHEPNKKNVAEVGPTAMKTLQSSSPPEDAVGPIQKQPVAAPMVSTAAKPLTTSPSPPPPPLLPTKESAPVVPTVAKPVPSPNAAPTSAKPVQSLPPGPLPTAVGQTFAKPGPSTMNKPVPPPTVDPTTAAPPTPAAPTMTIPVPRVPNTTKPVPQAPILPRLPTMANPSQLAEVGPTSVAGTRQVGPERRGTMTKVASNVNGKVGDYINRDRRGLRSVSNIGSMGGKS